MAMALSMKPSGFLRQAGMRIGPSKTLEIVTQMPSSQGFFTSTNPITVKKHYHMARHEAWDSGYMQQREITRLHIMKQCHKQNHRSTLLLSIFVIAAAVGALAVINNEAKLIEKGDTIKELRK